jgi:hypothetical protein
MGENQDVGFDRDGLQFAVVANIPLDVKTQRLSAITE